MKKEIIIFGITGLLVYNTYVDNKLSKSLKSFEKYIKIERITTNNIKTQTTLHKVEHLLNIFNILFII